MRLRRLEPVLRQALRGRCRLREGSRLLVAVSGGADSTALLAALASLAREFALEVHAAHLHHGLRGADADADFEHVRALCARLGVPLHAGRLRPASHASEGSLRTARRRFLMTVAKRARCVAIATAHTADDQLETTLMRLARGTGLSGLAGMRPRHGAWLKPLLEATRADIERDLAAARLDWREDASNGSRAFLRNRVRLDVVPALARAAAASASAAPTAAAEAASAPARARETLARHAAAAARELAEADVAIRRRARALLARATDAHQPGRLDLVAVAAHPEAAVRRAVLRSWWTRVCPDSSGLPRPALEALLGRLARPLEAAELALEGGRIARVRGGHMALDEKPSATSRRATASKGRRPSEGRPGNVMVRRRSTTRRANRSTAPARARAAERA